MSQGHGSNTDTHVNANGSQVSLSLVCALVPTKADQFLLPPATEGARRAGRGRVTPAGATTARAQRTGVNAWDGISHQKVLDAAAMNPLLSVKTISCQVI